MWIEGPVLFCAIGVLGRLHQFTHETYAQTLERGGSNPYNTMAMAGILGSVILLRCYGLAQDRAHRQARPASKPVVPVAAVSAVWSFDPSITLRRALTLSTTVGFGYYALAQFPVPAIIRRIAVVSLVSAVTSVAVAVAIPGIGVMTEGNLAGDWNGVFTHKQELGWAMFLGALCLGWLFMHDKGWRRLAYAPRSRCSSDAWSWRDRRPP